MVDLNLEMTVRNELPRITYLLQEVLIELKEHRNRLIAIEKELRGKHETN